MRILAILACVFAAGVAEAMTVRSKSDYRLWQTVFDPDAPLMWSWKENADAATVTFRPVLATRDNNGIVASRFGVAQTVEVMRLPADSHRGSCDVTRPTSMPTDTSLLEVTLTQTSNAVVVASETVQLAFPSPVITVRAKAGRDWWRVRYPRASGFDAAWWNVAGSSGYEVLWASQRGMQSVSREFSSTGVVDTASLVFGINGLCISVK